MSQYKNQTETGFKGRDARCGFTMHEPGLHGGSGPDTALYGTVILELCTCLLFPSKDSWRDWLSEAGEEGRKTEGEFKRWNR